MSAALEAAALGARVVVVDAAPQLGGQAVGALIGTFCGLYANGSDPEQVTHGIADAGTQHAAEVVGQILGQRMPTGVGVMQSVQIGLSQLEQETRVSTSGWR
jgi:NADPH-dependent 2,4-dienoyl-CoA reductase/sulfur reductase-like enzyme